MKKSLILIRTAPYGEASPAEGFRVIMTLPAMGIATTAVVMDDGVYCLVKKGDATRVGWRANVSEAFAQTREYEARLLVHGPSLQSRGVDTEEIIGHDGVLDEPALRDLIQEADVVLAF